MIMGNNKQKQDIQPQKNIQLVKKNSEDSENKQFYKWNIEQNLKYIEALYVLRDDLQYEFHRRSQKVFIKMSKIIKTKHADQCRTHHQKMMQRFKNLWTIIAYFKYKASLPQQISKRRKIDDHSEDFKQYVEFSKKLMDATLLNKQPQKQQSKPKQCPKELQLSIQFDEPQFQSPVFETQRFLDDQKNQSAQNNIFVQDYEEVDLYEASLNWNIDWFQYYEEQGL